MKKLYRVYFHEDGCHKNDCVEVQAFDQHTAVGLAHRKIQESLDPTEYKIMSVYKIGEEITVKI